MFNHARVADEILQPALPVAVLALIPFFPDISQAEHHNDFPNKPHRRDTTCK